MRLDEILSKTGADQPVLIAGPTAGGKSALAAEIVDRAGGVIVNADALQVYATWRILTARPSEDDIRALPHRLYGHVARDGAYSAGHWLREVQAVLGQGLRPVIVGGTGLYFQALTEGLVPVPPIPPQIRAEADARMCDAGPAALLADLDPATAARIDRRNPARVQRAWEVLRATGRGLAQWQADTGPPVLPRGRARALLVDPGRDALRQRIDARFDAMIAAGALDEVAAALPEWQPTLPYAKAIGAPELVAHLRGAQSLAAATLAAKTVTHQYAKRQRSWFRRRMADWDRVEAD